MKPATENFRFVSRAIGACVCFPYSLSLTLSLGTFFFIKSCVDRLHVIVVVIGVDVQQFCEWFLVLFYWLIFYGRKRRRCYALYHNKQNVHYDFLTGQS